jgi:glycosyltransferase involved in cell wall biosynthesis
VRERLGLAGKVTIGYVGAINFWRRVDLLIEAFAEVARQHADAHLVLIGEGPDRQAVADSARAAGLEGRVHLPGKVPHAEIPAHLAALDITVIPHSNTYGSPMKLFEYMAAGRVVVAPWLPPIVEVIGDDDGGVLFTPLDRGALVQALAALVSDASRRTALGARARQKALAGYVWRRHAQTILDIHQELVS